jgi:hypothetical protein
MSPKAPFILLEHFRLNRQDFRRGFAYTFRPGKRRRPTVLPIVSVDPPVMDGYGSNYRPYDYRPMVTTPLDLV